MKHFAPGSRLALQSRGSCRKEKEKNSPEETHTTTGSCLIQNTFQVLGGPRLEVRSHLVRNRGSKPVERFSVRTGYAQTFVSARIDESLP